MFGNQRGSSQRLKYLEKVRGVFTKKKDDQKEQAGLEDTHGKDEGKSDRDQYISRMTAKLDDWDNQIEELEKKSRQATTIVLEEHREQIRELVIKIRKGREKMKEIVESTDQAWHNIKMGTDAIFHDIKTNLDKARKAHHDELEDD